MNTEIEPMNSTQSLTRLGEGYFSGRFAARGIARLTLAGALLSGAVVAQAATVVPAPFRVNTYVSGDQSFPAAACNVLGNCVVAWQSDGEDGSLLGIYAQRFNAAGARVGSEFRVNTFTTNKQFQPAVAINASGAFVIVWDSSGQDDAGVSVRGQLYAASGAPMGSEFKVNTSTHDLSIRVGVGMDASGKFAVVWPEHFTSGGISFTKNSLIEMRRYNADGSAAGDPIDVASSLDTLRSPEIAMDAAGDSVVVWESESHSAINSSPTGLGVGIRGREYGADGKAKAVAFTANSAVASKQVDQPVVAIDSAGNYVIAWEALDTGLNPLGVVARRFPASGAASAEFAVGAATQLQHTPSIAMSPDGRFAIAGQSDRIYLQTYSATGVATGAVQTLDTTTATNVALLPTLTIGASGAGFAAWQSMGGDGVGSRAVLARYFSLP